MSLRTDIKYAIRNKLKCNIDYDSPDEKGYRKIWPVCFGYDRRTNNLTLRAYVESGRSHSKHFPQYRLFLIERINTLTVTANFFTYPLGYKRNDKYINVIQQL